MIRMFLSSWLIYWIGLLILPFTVIYPNCTQAFLIQAIFVIFVLFGYSLVANYAERHPPVDDASRLQRGTVLLAVSIFLSAAGLASLVYDKIIIQGIDYTSGLAAAREQWRVLGLHRTRASSPFSIFGYLVGCTYFVAAALVTARPRDFTRTTRFSVYTACFALALGNSIITGGRSVLFLLAAFVVAAKCLQPKQETGANRNWLDVAYGFAAVTVAIAYVVYVTIQRAHAAGQSVELYVLNGVSFLGLRLDDDYVKTFDGSLFSEVLSAIVFCAAYLVHSFASVCAMIDALPEDKPIVFIHALQLLSRLGLISFPDGEWFLVGRFPSLPGALWHQFGAAGLTVFALLTGAATGLAYWWRRRCPDQLLGIGFQLCCVVILMLSPLSFAGDFLAFPFVVIAFGIMAAIQAMLGKGRPIAAST